MADGLDTWIVTGVCAAGKTTVGRFLADELGLPFVEGDRIRPPADGPSVDRYRRLAAAARGAVVEDVILGSWLTCIVELASPCHVVVLAPPVEIVSARNAGRPKDGYAAWSLDGLDRVLRRETPRVGLWLDNGMLTARETVETIVARAAEARV